MTKEDNTAIKGEQRLSLEKLRKWESLKSVSYTHLKIIFDSINT